ncbi:Cof-type HAD-IIB family hydrolase [Staphylococcus massiliensis]|uniref:Putative haloacid dehalogenase-like hydrolase n=1 Tax=Staphylococcus massiliensis S46 TaxID=1229783 RepID=K9AJF1_9STAP|nr:Cof-type HAD-IIB family hydrolase [Staphylococcus massiliensis]EKU47433.1 putative haloacid dehalogenase-like hydrolase [Staphylococcus massiliensis S46]MCG3400350.1 Cof-type HAD-IIB family hydrolase [Staphylococcus massiliensis]MCG3401956.1 Cof-type HAD-IIB family hydrolase [Staphylococcus massiliensis]MCG3412380.1 Cof-type HAD-IIB family hydrolase [Staphylococcus massiliensis]POA00921.1 Cof-type HAD-IIB family hydrolase [Staphylococcus massiliensis CCUG 55927]
MIKLIATDMDGTLLNAAHEITEDNINAIKFAQDNGIPVVIATGRAFYEANGPVQDTALKVPYICLNGAEVRDESFDILHTSSLNHELLQKIRNVLNAENIYYQVYTNFGIYTEDPERDLEIYMDIARKAGQKGDEAKIRAGIQQRIDNGTLKVVDNYDQIESVPGEIIMKLLAYDADLDKIDRANRLLSESTNLAVSSSSRGNLEITHSDAQKGIALGEIADQLGIDMKHVMAIGDNRNDLSMLNRVGYPVAMNNAVEEVKDAATLVTLTNEESGVAHAIFKLLKEENGLDFRGE